MLTKIHSHPFRKLVLIISILTAYTWSNDNLSFATQKSDRKLKESQIQGYEVFAKRAMPYEVLDHIAKELSDSQIALVGDVLKNSSTNNPDLAWAEGWLTHYWGNRVFQPSMKELRNHFSSNEIAAEFLVHFINQHKVSRLKLSLMRAKDMSELQVAEILEKCPTLLSLDLTDSGIDMRPLNHVSSALKRNKTLLTLNLTRVDLNPFEMPIEKQGAMKNLSEAMKVNKTLRLLILRETELDSEDSPYVINILRADSGLIFMDVIDNFLNLIDPENPRGIEFLY